jgi:DUF4097 and DUF4098 domain-containing protein YvlB
VIVQGWALDKVRVLGTKLVQTETEEKAREQFKIMGINNKEVSGNLEIFSEVGHGLDISEKIRKRKDESLRMDLVIKAPAKLDLVVISPDGSVQVSGLRGKIEVRGGHGEIKLSDLHSSGASVTCVDCPIRLEKMSGPLRCVGGSGAVVLDTVESDPLFVQTDQGSIQATAVQGKQLYVTKTGGIAGRDLSGRVEFKTQQGSVTMLDLRGFASGSTRQGSIKTTVREWQFVDKALFESDNGDIDIALPSTFMGQVDLHSELGKADLGFILSEGRGTLKEPGHLVGQVGQREEGYFKVHTKRGNIRIRKSD